MTPTDLEGDEVLGWASRRRLAAQSVVTNELGQVVSQTTPVFDQEGLLTPTAAWYIVQHLAIPDPIHPFDWSLTVDGRVRDALDLSYEALQRLPVRTVRVLLECSGSDAEYFLRDLEPDAELTPDQRRRLASPRSRPTGMLLSAAEFTGVPLAAVLERAGLLPDAVSVRLNGADRGRPHDDPDWEEISYDKALPLAKALDPDTLLAWAMNGEYLDHIHGAPVRAVVPGWSGNWHIKWLDRVEVLAHPGDCYYQTRYYVYGPSLDEHEEMVTQMPVKALVTWPRPEGATWSRGEHVIRGLAWSGAGRIAQVEVSLDGGERWQAARLEEPRERWLWVRWSFPTRLEAPGPYTIVARATDEAGRVQGTSPRYDDRGHNFQLKNYAGIVPVSVVIEP